MLSTSNVMACCSIVTRRSWRAVFDLSAVNRILHTSIGSGVLLWLCFNSRHVRCTLTALVRWLTIPGPRMYTVVASSRSRRWSLVGRLVDGLTGHFPAPFALGMRPSWTMTIYSLSNRVESFGSLQSSTDSRRCKG